MIEHPLGGERSEGIARRARQAVDQLTKALNTPTGATPGEIGRAEPGRTFLGPPSVQADLTDLATTDDPEGILAAFCEREWCDGLPIVPPTEARVQAMLEPSFNLYGVQATTHPVAPLLIVHGRSRPNSACTAGAAASVPAFAPTRRSAGRSG